MPVLLTAAHQPLARRLVLRLLQEGGEVRAFTDGDAMMLRAAGAFVATGSPDDEGRLEAALEQVHTLVHVGGGLTTDPARIAQDAEVAARAAAGAGVQRIIALSLPGADPAAPDPLRRAKAAAEAAFAASPCPSIVLRVGLIDTHALRDLLVTGGIGGEGLGAEVSPVRLEDVIELVVGFDRARSRADSGHLVVRAEGPERVSVAAYLANVGVALPSAGGRVGRRLPDEATSDRLRSVLVGPWTDPDPTLVDGWGFAALEPRPPRG